MENFAPRHPKILKKANTALLVIDIQEKILPVIFEHERVIDNTLKLINGMKIMGIPVYFTEQYPKGLGPTTPVVKQALEGAKEVQKLSFSCAGEPSLFQELKEKNLSQIVVCGIESHVCVQQTALDMLVNGFQIDIAYDAVSSRREKDYQIALDRMRQNGVEVTSTESILFELLNVSGTEEFKAVSKLVK